MNEKTIATIIKVSIPSIIAIGAGIFVVKVVKEYKKQYSELKDELDETNEILSQTVNIMDMQEAEMKEVIYVREDEIENLKEAIRSATFDDVDYTGKFTPNDELEEMRKRTMRSLEVAKEQRAEKVVKNIFHDDSVVKFDIPLDGSRREISEKMIEGKKDAMRYDINSNEAMDAFINLAVSDWEDETQEFINETTALYHLDDENRSLKKESIIEALRSLFQFTLPGSVNEYDENIIVDMLEQRRQFFTGASEFSNHISYAELIIYWVNKVNFDMGGSYLAFADYFMAELGIWSAQDEEALASNFEKVMTHELWNDDKFGMFGLTSSEVAYGRSGENGRFMNQYNSFIQRLVNFEDDN